MYHSDDMQFEIVSVIDKDSVFYKVHTKPKKRSVIKIINLLKPTGHVMHEQFNIQQLYVLPTLYLCVLYLSENKQWLVPLTA